MKNIEVKVRDTLENKEMAEFFNYIHNNKKVIHVKEGTITIEEFLIRRLKYFKIWEEIKEENTSGEGREKINEMMQLLKTAYKRDKRKMKKYVKFLQKEDMEELMEGLLTKETQVKIVRLMYREYENYLKAKEEIK